LSENTELIKASAAIQMENELTELQRLTVNVLLYNAYNELPNLGIEKHRIAVSDLTKAVGYQSNSLNYLKRLLKDIQSKPLEFNLLRKDKTEKWGTYALLAEAEIEDGHCYYAFGPTLRRLFYNPKVYARINLSIQSKLRHKYATPLFEICVDYLNETKRYGETPWMQLPVLKRLIGAPQDMEFKILNRDAIKPAIERIETKTDFRIAVERKKTGRSISALKFRIRQELIIPAQQEIPKDLLTDESSPEIIKELIEAGLPESDAGAIWQQQFEFLVPDKRRAISPNKDFSSYIREKIDLLKRGQVQKKIKNPTGFLLKAIKEDYANPSYNKKKESITTEERKKTQSVLIKQKELEEKRSLLDVEYSDRKFALCEQIANDDPRLLERVMQEVREENLFAGRDFDKSKSVLQNYLDTHGLRSLVDERLMSEYPDKFHELRKAHRKEINSLDKDIEKIQAML